MKKFAVCYQASFQELKHVKTLTTAAMLMAIVANKLNKPLNELRFKSIKEVK